MRERSREVGLTVGLDLGDRMSHFVVLDSSGGQVEEGRLATSEAALGGLFSRRTPMRVALETGTHSPWVSRVIESFGHEVVVANSRKLRLIYENANKSDRVDALYLARLSRADPELLSPVRHRGADTQKDLALLRSREALVSARTLLINHARGQVKSVGRRLRGCSTGSFARAVTDEIPESLQPGLMPVIELIAHLSDRIKAMDGQILILADQDYPETKRLRQVKGIGPITSLAFVLTLEDPHRFSKSRIVAAYLGLVPGRKQSGRSDPERRITKEGDSSLRRLLVNAAHYILGPFGPDSNLRRFGLKIAARGGKIAKKKAVIAVARKLAVLLHYLWRSGQTYQPLYQNRAGRRLRAVAS